MSTHAEVTINNQGRIVIPIAIREELGFHPGDTLIAHVENGGLVIESRATILNRIQNRFAHVPKDVSLADELIAERRLEFAKEAAAMAEFEAKYDLKSENV